MAKVNNKNTRIDVDLVFKLLALNIFNTFLGRLYWALEYSFAQKLSIIVEFLPCYIIVKTALEYYG